jgi:type I restriction enzyme, S subunit
VKVSTHSLDEVCEKITDGTHHSPPIVECGIPYVTAKHIKLDGVKFFDDPWYVSKSDHDEIYSRCDPRVGDVLYIKDGATTGTATVNRLDFPFSMLSSVALIRPRKDICDPDYLAAWLNSPLVNAGHLMRMGGAAIKRLTLAKIKGFEIPLPPLAEQKRIAGILDAADALRAKRREALAQLDILLQATFLDLFGDPVTNPKGWELRTLGDELTLQGGYAFKSSDYTKTGVRLVKISNVHKDNLEWGDIEHLPVEYLEEFSDFSLHAGDVVLALTRPIIQSLKSVKIAVVQSSDVPCLLNQRVGRFRFQSNSRLSPAYLLEYCRTKTFFHAVQSFCSESLQPNMSTSQVESIKIAVPPITLQLEFTRLVTAVEALKAMHGASLTELDTLFASLQSRAFRGEL